MVSPTLVDLSDVASQCGSARKGMTADTARKVAAVSVYRLHVAIEVRGDAKRRAAFAACEVPPLLVNGRDVNPKGARVREGPRALRALVISALLVDSNAMFPKAPARGKSRPAVIAGVGLAPFVHPPHVLGKVASELEDVSADWALVAV